MSEQNPAAASAGSQSTTHIQNQSSNQVDAKLSSQAEHQCADCIKGSFNPVEGGSKLITQDAIDKLSIIKQALSDNSTVTQQIDYLIQTLEQGSVVELNQKNADEFVKKQFAAALASSASHMDGALKDPNQIQLHAVPNPFRPQDPFRAKVPQSDSAENHLSEDDEKEKAPKKKKKKKKAKGLLDRILGL